MRARCTVLVETSGAPPVGVNVVVSVTVSACCRRARRAAFVSAQVSVMELAVVMVLVVVQTVMLLVKVARRGLVVVPVWVATPGPVAVKTVVIAELVEARVLTERTPGALFCGAGALVEVAASAPSRIIRLSAAVGVTALEAAESVLVPLPFVAVARKVYAVPFVRPVMVQLVAGTVMAQDLEPSCTAVTRNESGALPSAPAVTLTVA